jgi:hypothetical protein
MGLRTGPDAVMRRILSPCWDSNPTYRNTAVQSIFESGSDPSYSVRVEGFLSSHGLLGCDAV